MTRLATLAATVALLAAMPAAAQERGTAATRDYAEAAAQSDAFEIAAAKTVLAQSRDADVRAFAQQMLADHTRLAAALRKASAEAGIKPPAMGLGGEQAAWLGALGGLNGPDLGRTYWRQQALAHRAALAAAQDYAGKGDDAAMRAEANAAVPVITGHLATAERMATRPPG